MSLKDGSSFHALCMTFWCVCVALFTPVTTGQSKQLSRREESIHRRSHLDIWDIFYDYIQKGTRKETYNI